MKRCPFFFITGNEIDGAFVLDQWAEFAHQKRSIVGVTADTRSTHKLLIKLEQFGHRLLAMVVGVTIVAIWLRARRTQTMHPTITRLAGYASGLVLVQIVLGAANVSDRLSALTVVPHLAVGSLTWGTMFLLVLHADRFAGTVERDPAEPEPAAQSRGVRESAAAYFLLTKPRIIELLLVTTVPTMFIAKRGVPSPLLIATTLFGGSLSAASANVLNCYLDRDIDQRMRRTATEPTTYATR